ncbi:MAG: vWA domain-containing protein [Verrucomicrobiia bacterium]
MDVAFVIDDTGSMGGAIANVKAALPEVIAAAESASCLDLRMGLVTFPNDNVVVSQPLTTDITAVQNAIRALVAGGGAGEPESSDEALQYVVTGAADMNCSVVALNGPFGTFRPGCVKMAILVTDAHPGGCDDTFIVGVDDVHAHLVATEAAASNVLVSAIYVPTFGEASDIKAIMQDYATTSGGIFDETESDGVGTGDSIIANIAATCGIIASQQCATRNARFWFTHAFGTGVNTNCADLCADLLDAIKFNGGALDLGFIGLPTTYYTGSSLTSTDALIEALSFYWRSTSQTGDSTGGSSLLCRARKLLAAELIAATANVRLLGTQPSNCTYVVNGTTFPADLLSQARNVAAGEDVAACLAMTKLLQEFNSSGATNGFPSGLVECSAGRQAALKKLSHDPTTKLNCPGKNDQCETAEAVVLTYNTNTFKTAPFKRSFNTTVNSTGLVSDGTLHTYSASAWYKITPDVGSANRWFTASTAGSNFDTLLSVWQGNCATNGLSLVAVNNNYSYIKQGRVITSNQALVKFQTDGTNTFFIVVGSAKGGYGKANIKVTSP